MFDVIDIPLENTFIIIVSIRLVSLYITAQLTDIQPQVFSLFLRKQH